MTLNIISLGAGVQSSTLALMAAHGEITPHVDAAVFADTQAEPASVMRWLDQLEGFIAAAPFPFPVHRVTNGNLFVDSTKLRTSVKSGQLYMSHSVPAFVLNENGTKGTYLRQCTDLHKLTPLRRKIDELRGKNNAIVWIGISTDEAHRMKPSQRRGVDHIWPLIDANVSRSKCLQWMQEKNYPTPPRSACVFCPYHNDKEWTRLKTQEPEEFARAVSYEQFLQSCARQTPRLTGIPFLHASRIPLDQVDFRSAEDAGQQVMFGNECQGMCGV